MKQIDTSTYNFPEIIANDFLYIDKTEFIWKLVSKKKGEYFLSRPRRFGKSLLISTLKAFFQGRRELFKGLAIDKEAYDWKAYPVIHLDFGACVAATSDELATFLQFRLEESAAEHGVELTAPTPQECFIELVKKLAKKGSKQDTDGRVVVLVDEYDKPILSNVTNPNVPEILKLLKGFYGVIKTYEGLIRFALITGVSKFAHVSLFSSVKQPAARPYMKYSSLILNKSILALQPFKMVLIVFLIFLLKPRLLAASLHVPAGIYASLGFLSSFITALITSWTVPSPPTHTKRSYTEPLSRI